MTEGRAQRILITGAAGKIGRSLRLSLAGSSRVLRLFDIEPMESSNGLGEEVVQGDILEPGQVRDAVRGCDAVVHLAGISGEDSWDRILKVNLEGTHIVLEACREEGVKRFLYASSNHAMGYFPIPDSAPVSMTEPARPDSYYGFSKASAELLCRLYYDSFGIDVCCLRIGAFAEAPKDANRMRTLITRRDLAQLVDRALVVPSLGYLVVGGASRNRELWWDDTPARSLGYEPQDDAWAIADDSVRSEPDPKGFLGGRFPEYPLGATVRQDKIIRLN